MEVRCGPGKLLLTVTSSLSCADEEFRISSVDGSLAVSAAFTWAVVALLLVSTEVDRSPVVLRDNGDRALLDLPVVDPRGRDVELVGDLTPAPCRACE